IAPRPPAGPGPSTGDHPARHRSAAEWPAPRPDTGRGSGPHGPVPGSSARRSWRGLATLRQSAALLERLGHLRRHVVFIVLGQHLIGDQYPFGIQLAEGNDALLLAEQVR